MPSKRKRVSSTTPAKSSNDADSDMQKHVLFTDWSKRRGVETSDIKPAKLSGRGLGLITTRSIKSNQRLLFVPEKSMFQPDPALLKKHTLQNASPQAQLTFTALSRCHAAGSSYRVWRNTWPTSQDMHGSLPLCWQSQLRELLPPTATAVFQRQLADYEKDKQAVQAALTSLEISERDFMYYWLIINSRSFHWKSSSPKSKGVMVMCPFIDYMNHGPTGTGCKVLQTNKGYEVIAERNYVVALLTKKLSEAGEEILATYGAHSNDKLLVHYGFVCSTDSTCPNIDDSIGLDHLLLPALSETTKSQLQDVGFLGGYAILPASNEICFKTQVAVRAALLTCNEWEYFVTNGEDLSDDRSSQVAIFLQPLLQQYRVEAEKKLKTLAELEIDENSHTSMTAIATLRTRWRQIYDGVEAFLRIGRQSR